jgi:hypothetical protein
MNSEKLLRQYVDTGIVISEHQFNKLPPNLRKTYLRKRFIAIYNHDSYMELFEFKSFGSEEIEKLKSRPKFISYFYDIDSELILSNFYNTFDKNSSAGDVEILVRRTPIGPKLDAVTDKIYKVFGKDVDFYNVVSEIMKKYDDLDLKMEVAYKYLNVIEGELTVDNAIGMSYLRDMYRFYICKKLINDYPSEKWLQLIHILFDRNMGEEYLVPILNMIMDKGLRINGVHFSQCLKKITESEVMLGLIEKSFKTNYKILSFYFTDLFTYADGVTDPFYLNILQSYLKYQSKNMGNYDIERLLSKCPQEQIVQAKSMIDKATSSDTLNEDIKRIKELL